jgi:hypothetical protein
MLMPINLPANGLSFPEPIRCYLSNRFSIKRLQLGVTFLVNYFTVLFYNNNKAYYSDYVEIDLDCFLEYLLRVLLFTGYRPELDEPEAKSSQRVHGLPGGVHARAEPHRVAESVTRLGHHSHLHQVSEKAICIRLIGGRGRCCLGRWGGGRGGRP